MAEVVQGTGLQNRTTAGSNPALPSKIDTMSINNKGDKEHLEEDFPLSGGQEADFQIKPWVFVVFFIFISLVIAATMHMKGVF